MTYLKPYWTLDHNHVTLDDYQRLRLRVIWLIKRKQTRIHINQLARRYRIGYIEEVNLTQIKEITRLFENVGYRFKDWEMRKTQVWNSHIYDHNK